MPTATMPDGTELEYTPPTSAPVASVHIVKSRWMDADHTEAVARVGNRWIAYHPTDDGKTQYSIRDARDAGVLTGQVAPSEYVAPEPAPVPTPGEVAIAELQARDASGEDTRVIEDLVDAILALGGTVPQPVIDRINARRGLRAHLGD